MQSESNAGDAVPVIDASVLVAAYVPNDLHHRAAQAWPSHAIEHDEALHIPILALAEVGGAIARQTGDSPLANKVIGTIRALELAISLKLCGADAAYASLAHQLADVLVTFDDEQRERAGQVVETHRP